MRSTDYKRQMTSAIRLPIAVAFAPAIVMLIICGHSGYSGGPGEEGGRVPERQRSAYAGMSEREVWAYALRGDYAEVVKMYLEGERPGEESVEYDDRRFDRRGACIDSLASIFDDGAQQALLEMLEAKRPSDEIVEALACSESEEIISGLFEVYERRKEDLPFAGGVARSGCLRTDPRAVDAFCRLKPLCYKALAFLIDVPSSATVVHSKAQKRLCEYIMQHKQTVYRHSYLCDIECSGIQDLVRQMLNEPDPEIFKEAIPLLFKLPEDEALKYLVHFSNSDDQYTRNDVAFAATRLSTERVIPIVRLLSRDPYSGVRASVAEGMNKPFPGSEEIALRLSKDPESLRVREYATRALIMMRSAHAKGASLSLLRQAAACDYSIGLDSEEVEKYPGIISADELRPVVILLARNNNKFVRAGAARLIRVFSLKDSESILEPLLTDKHRVPRREAYKALYRINPDRLREIVHR